MLVGGWVEGWWVGEWVGGGMVERSKCPFSLLTPSYSCFHFTLTPPPSVGQQQYCGAVSVAGPFSPSLSPTPNLGTYLGTPSLRAVFPPPPPLLPTCPHLPLQHCQ